jgi:hypothetical protein
MKASQERILIVHTAYSLSFFLLPIINIIVAILKRLSQQRRYYLHQLY